MSTYCGRFVLSQLAMVQTSDVLPIGERMKMTICSVFYSMVYVASLRSSTVWYD